MNADPAAEDRAALSKRVASIQWYHTLELAPGLVTPGWLDHRPIVGRVPLPRSLAGKRCLDLATFNGYWAFELERRGAAEVVALDVFDPRRWDWPVDSDEATVAEMARRVAGGAGFEIAHAALGSRVKRIDRSVYEIEEGELGRFDLVFLGSLLIHLRDPVRALERVREVCDGELIVVDGIDLPLSLRSTRLPLARLDGRGRPWWWFPNLAGLARLVETAGFELIGRPHRLFVPPGAGRPRSWDPRAARSREGRFQLVSTWLGDPHGVVVARRATPVPSPRQPGAASG
jgi:tRNA (mo5U34)-methyltransferase